MHCTNCGAVLEPNARFCTSCGATVAQAQPQQAYQQPTYQQPVYQQPVYQQPTVPFAPVPANLTWKEFYNRFVTKKGFVTWMAVICFFTAAMSAALLFLVGNPLSIMDIIVYLISGILLVSSKHWVSSLIPTIYGGIFSIVSIVLDGPPSGIVAIVVGIAATNTLLKASKAYEKYKLDGTAPTEPI